MYRSGSNCRAGYVASCGRSEIPRGRTLDAAHSHYAEPILTGSGSGAGLRDSLSGRESLVALFVARALFGSPSTPGGLVPHPNRPLVTLPIVVNLSAISDLTDPAEAVLIETNAQELTGEWRTGKRIP